jgi:hypothetical protein
VCLLAVAVCALVACSPVHTQLDRAVVEKVAKTQGWRVDFNFKDGFGASDPENGSAVAVRVLKSRDEARRAFLRTLQRLGVEIQPGRVVWDSPMRFFPFRIAVVCNLRVSMAGSPGEDPAALAGRFESLAWALRRECA